MHDCLTIPEILSIIFENFYETHQPAELASLATTCRAFTEPALDVLWRDQLDLRYLVLCFPLDIVAWSSAGNVSLLRPLNARDWERFDFYASRVWRFGISRFESHSKYYQFETYNDVFRAIREYKPARTSLFPNLRHFCMHISTHTSLQLWIFQQLLTHAVTSIDIVITDHSYFGDLYSSEIIHLSPNVQHFKLYCFCSPILFQSDAPIFTLICSLHHLRGITLTDIQIPMSVAARLASLPSLTTLKRLKILSSEVGFFTTVRFSNLKEFSMSVDDWSSSTTVLSSMNCVFNALSVHRCSGREPLSALRDCIATLHPSFGSLSAIDLVDLMNSPYTDIDVPDAIRPLLSCKRLRVVTLKLACLEVLDDSWLLEAAAAWPSLEVLSLAVYKSENPQMSFKGLVSLIRDLPKLQEIHLPLDMDTVDASLLDDVPIGHLRHLSIAHPRLAEESLDVQESLRNMFPKLRFFMASNQSTGVWTLEAPRPR